MLTKPSFNSLPQLYRSLAYSNVRRTKTHQMRSMILKAGRDTRAELTDTQKTWVFFG